MPSSSTGLLPELHPGGIFLSGIQKTVLKNLEYLYLRVPRCRALLVALPLPNLQQRTTSGASLPRARVLCPDSGTHHHETTTASPSISAVIASGTRSLLVELGSTTTYSDKIGDVGTSSSELQHSRWTSCSDVRLAICDPQRTPPIAPGRSLEPYMQE